MNKAEEVWAQVKNYEGLYEVSSYGRVRRVATKKVKGKILKLSINKANGYVTVGLHKNGNVEQKRVHCLVMDSFYPVNRKKGYDSQYTVNHIDGDKTNNYIGNLEWCTQSENQIHAYKLGLQKKKGEKVICLDTGEIYETYTDAARSCGGNTGEMVKRVCDGKRSHYRTLHFARLKDYQNNSIPQYSGKVSRKASVRLWR